MSSFEVAWDSIIKAPWLLETGNLFDEKNPTTIDGPLYSGGDISDDPRYWTDDFNEALAYALFGSAIPVVGLEDTFRENVPMRETVPTIRIAPDPGYGWRNEKGHVKSPKEFEESDEAIQNFLLFDDPESEAYMHDEQWGAPKHEIMDEDKMRKLLLSLIEGQDDMFTWGNTGTYKTADERKAHIKAALERFDTGRSGRLWLDEMHKPLSQTSETDGIEDSDDIEYLQEWGRLNDEDAHVPWKSFMRE